VQLLDTTIHHHNERKLMQSLLKVTGSSLFLTVLSQPALMRYCLRRVLCSPGLPYACLWYPVQRIVRKPSQKSLNAFNILTGFSLTIHVFCDMLIGEDAPIFLIG